GGGGGPVRGGGSGSGGPDRRCRCRPTSRRLSLPMAVIHELNCIQPSSLGRRRRGGSVLPPRAEHVSNSTRASFSPVTATKPKDFKQFVGCTRRAEGLNGGKFKSV